MPAISLSYNSRIRNTPRFPPMLHLNMLVEKDSTNPFGGVTHIQRPGMVALATVGAGPIRGMYRQAGTFNGAFLIASGTSWYRMTEAGTVTTLGALPGTRRTTTAATQTRAITTSNNAAYSTDGTSVTQVIMPDGRTVSSVAQLNGYFIFTEQDTTRFYWIAPGQTNPDGLNFASTESAPGVNRKVERVGDELWFFKQESMEVWIPTGDVDLPFQRVPGRNFDIGTRTRETVVRFDNTVVWVGNDNVCYRGGGVPERFSTPDIEEQIRLSVSEDIRAWSFGVDGHRLYVLTLTGGTFVFDLSSGLWTQFRSTGRSIWRAHLGETGDSAVLAGDSESGVVYRLDPSVGNDAGAIMTRILTGFVPVNGQPVRCNSVQVHMVTGANSLSSAPTVSIAYSDNLQTLPAFDYDIEAGASGAYGGIVRANGLGLMTYPGRLFQFRVTQDMVFTVMGATYNEPSR